MGVGSPENDAIKECVPVNGDTYDVPLQVATFTARRKSLNQPRPKMGHPEKFGTLQQQREYSAVNHVAPNRGRASPSAETQRAPRPIPPLTGHRSTVIRQSGPAAGRVAEAALTPAESVRPRRPGRRFLLEHRAGGRAYRIGAGEFPDED